MQSGFIFGIIGAVLLLIGVFVPLVSLPLYGGISLLQIQEPVAIVLLVLAAAHLIFCINRVAWGLYVTKIGSARGHCLRRLSRLGQDHRPSGFFYQVGQADCQSSLGNRAARGWHTDFDGGSDPCG